MIFSLKTSSTLNIIFASLLILVLVSPVSAGNRQRLERKHGVVNHALQDMLSAQIGTFPSGIGKIEMGRGNGFKANCTADIFVSSDTMFVALESKKTSVKAEFYVDHPYDSFRNVLFQALVTQGNETELSVDQKTGGYKFKVKGSKLEIEVKQKGTVTSCAFDLSKAVLFPGETE